MKPKPRRATSREQQLQFDMEFAKRMLFEEGQCRPMYVIENKTETYLIPASWSDRDQKMAVVDFVRLAAVAYDAEAVTCITEAWLRSVMRTPGETDAEHEKRATAVLPADAEDRQEALIVSTQYRDAAGEIQCIGKSVIIERDWNGKATGVKELHDGAMVPRGQAILTQRRMSEDIRKLAMKALEDMSEFRPSKVN